MTIKSRIKALENRAKQARNDRITNNNYSEEEHKRSLELLYEAIIKMSNNGQLENSTGKYNSVDPVVDEAMNELVKGLFDYIDRKEAMEKRGEVETEEN